LIPGEKLRHGNLCLEYFLRDIDLKANSVVQVWQEEPEMAYDPSKIHKVCKTPLIDRYSST